MKNILCRSLVVVLLAGATVVANPVPASAAVPPSEWVIGPQAPVVMITFDGQARAKQFLSIKETLKEKKTKASFFISGQWVQFHKDKARGLRKQGNFLGNRGYGTTPFTQMDSDAIKASVARAQAELAKVGASPAPYLRAPNGQRDLRVLQAAGSLGYRSVRWTYRAGGGTERKVLKKVRKHIQAGAIISLDPWRKSHREALSKIIGSIRRRGFSLRTVESLANAHAVRWDVTLKAGSQSSEVAYLQKTLKSISYPAGATDGNFGYATLQAVYAFEKVYGLTRDGVVTPAQMSAIAVAQRPKVPRRDPRNYVDVDISRQVVFEVRDRKVTHTTPMSSGNEEYYTVDGATYKAHTPRGDFVIERKIKGERVSRLGTLYDPSYFVGGYAFHGSSSVPVYPASHGCIRLPMYQSLPFFNRNPVGMPVYIHE